MTDPMKPMLGGYAVTIKRNEDGSWFGKVDDFPGCMTEGGSPVEVLGALRDAKREWMKSERAMGHSIPKSTLKE